MTAPQVDARHLVTWSLSTFHASAFVLAIVLFLYSRDVLGPALGGLNTLVGLGLFVALWATTYATTARAIAGLDPMATESDGERYWRRALRWGAANGIAFLAVLAIVFVGSVALTAPGILITAVIASPFAIAVAAVVGAVVGTILGVIDLGLYALARSLIDARPS
jgi:hypothetical protein